MTQFSKRDSPTFCPRVSVDPGDSEEIFQRLRSPAQVTEEEKACVNQILHDAESDFANYDAEIVRPEAAFSALMHKRKCLQDYVAQHRSLLAPVRRLPPEVLSLIFHIHCRQESSKNTLVFGKPKGPGNRLTSIVLSQVSIGWRRVALESPRLWSHFMLVLNLDGPTRQQGMACFQDLLSLFLKRSLQVPLTVDLQMLRMSFRDRDFLATVKEILESVYRRCRSLVIDCIPEINSAVRTSYITDLPYLEHLKLSAGNLMEDRTPTLPVTYRAPRLRHLELIPVDNDWPEYRPRDFSSPTFQEFPWAQIIRLKLSCLQVLDLWKFLGRCVHLSELTVRGIRVQELAGHQIYPDVMNEPELFAFLRLATIDLHFEDSEDLAYALTIVFSKLTAPALKHLTISSSYTLFGYPRPTWPLDIFSSFTARSADPDSGLFTLSSLHVKRFPITVVDLLSVLNRLPCLIELEITEPRYQSSGTEERLFRVSDEFLHGLCIGTDPTGRRLFEGEEPCVPRLLHFRLNLTPRSEPEFRTETLNEMVRSRWIPDPACASAMGVACLRSIKVVGDKRTGEEALGYESLRELERSGLQVEIS